MNRNEYSTSNPPRCSIYTRAAPALGPEDAVIEHQRQESACRECLAPIPHQLLGVFHDQAGPAFSDGRPRLQKLAGLAAQGKLDRIVTCDLFRFSEKPYELKSFARFLQLCRVRIVCVFDLEGHHINQPSNR